MAESDEERAFLLEASSFLTFEELKLSTVYEVTVTTNPGFLGSEFPSIELCTLFLSIDDLERYALTASESDISFQKPGICSCTTDSQKLARENLILVRRMMEQIMSDGTRMRLFCSSVNLSLVRMVRSLLSLSVRQPQCGQPSSSTVVSRDSCAAYISKLINEFDSSSNEIPTPVLCECDRSGASLIQYLLCSMELPLLMSFLSERISTDDQSTEQLTCQADLFGWSLQTLLRDFFFAGMSDSDCESIVDTCKYPSQSDFEESIPACISKALRIRLQCLHAVSSYECKTRKQRSILDSLIAKWTSLNGRDILPLQYWLLVRPRLIHLLNDSLLNKSEHISPVILDRFDSNDDAKTSMFVVLNPVSGTSKGKAVWETVVQPMLDRLDCFDYTLHVTQSETDASETLKQMSDFSDQFDFVLIIGGDGSIAGVINGLYQKQMQNESQFKNCQRLCSLAVIPCGSGNALGLELGIKDAKDAVSRLSETLFVPMDGMLAKQESGPFDRIGFVSCQWGSIASVDFDSEKYRWLGTARFDVRAVTEILWNVQYKAKVYYLPMISNRTEDEGKMDHECALSSNEINHSHSCFTLPSSLAMVSQSLDDCQLWKDIRECRLPSSQWKMIESDRISVMAVCNLKTVSSDFLIGGKNLSMCDGTMKLIMADGLSRWQLTEGMMAAATATHEELGYFMSEKVSAVVFEPLMDQPYLDLDGERIPVEPVLIQCVPSLFSVAI